MTVCYFPVEIDLLTLTVRESHESMMETVYLLSVALKCCVEIIKCSHFMCSIDMQQGNETFKGVYFYKLTESTACFSKIGTVQFILNFTPKVPSLFRWQASSISWTSKTASVCVSCKKCSWSKGIKLKSLSFLPKIYIYNGQFKLLSEFIIFMKVFEGTTIHAW